MKHLEQNKLIAAFMGWEEMTNTKSKNWMEFQILEGSVKCAKRECSPERMRFPTSWDWLMPVVEKIYTMQDYRQSEPYYNVCKCYLPTPIELVYSLVVKFIEWYFNQQPPHLTQVEKPLKKNIMSLNYNYNGALEAVNVKVVTFNNGAPDFIFSLEQWKQEGGWRGLIKGNAFNLFDVKKVIHGKIDPVEFDELPAWEG